jgi:GABA(A) receptor-associated protein
MGSYKRDKSFESRNAEATRVREKYPDRVCVICERAPRAGAVGKLDKCKYLVPHSLTVGQFMFIIRKKLNIESSQAIFIFVNDNILPPTSREMGHLYEEYKDEDGLLYMLYATENTFGDQMRLIV